MAETSTRRFIVSNLGFAFAVHDTRAPAEYPHPAGKGKKHLSTNMYNTEIVEIFPTRAQAVADALERNRAEEAGG